MSKIKIWIISFCYHPKWRWKNSFWGITGPLRCRARGSLPHDSPLNGPAFDCWNVTKRRLRGGEAAGDGVADVVEAGLSHSSQSPPSFHVIQLSLFLMYCDWYCVVSCILLPVASAFWNFNVGFCFMFSEKTHCGWLMKIFIHQRKLVVYYNLQICDANLPHASISVSYTHLTLPTTPYV